MCSHADGRREIALLSVAGSDHDGKNGSGGFAADCIDAGPSGAAYADGNPVGVLNSSLAADVQSGVLQKAIEGEYRLLYLSPERLAREDTFGWLRRVPISFFAIDEAHCISEWGHEFRPEYRQLSRLREHFPEMPIAAFTASATRRVRHDIIAQLELREPDKYIASFHRPNLQYIVKECEGRTQDELLDAGAAEVRGRAT